MSMLLLPNGITVRKQSEISAEEMAWLASAEDILGKLKMSIVCRLCRQPVNGSNSPTDSVISVQCECRRLNYRVREDARA